MVARTRQRQTLEEKIRVFEADYRKIGMNLLAIFQRKEVTIDDLQAYAANIPISVRRHYHELVMATPSAMTKPTLTVSEFIEALNVYSCFVIPNLMADCVKIYGDEETKALMANYNTRIQQFHSATKMSDFVAVWDKLTEEGNEEAIKIFGADWQDKTIREIVPPLKRTWLIKNLMYGFKNGETKREWWH